MSLPTERNQGSRRIWLTPELGQGKYKMKLEHFMPELKEMLKRIMTQEAAWPNLGTNGRAGVRDGSPENTTGIHKPILAYKVNEQTK